ncbi:MAG TPA: ectonucleotide pyrophosphatase/phosphodiesterase [Puia sp.]
MRFYLFLAVFLIPAALSAQNTDSTQMVIPGRSNSPEQEQKPYVILISADGFRHDLADKYNATHLQALRAQGVRASSMTPSYPSVTFPNHYSLATGLYPSHHGLVDNNFFDVKKGRGYTIRDRSAVEDPDFYGGTPIWVLAEQQKMLSASFFWVGSETVIDGVRPTYYYKFNDKISLDTRLKAVKDWLTLPEAQRPHLITFYLSWVDHAEHYYGPNSKETDEAVHQVDNAIDRMTRMVDSLHLPVNYIFVSDHGMAQTDTSRGIPLPDVVDTSKFIVSIGGTMVHLYAKDKKDIVPLYTALKTVANDYYVYLPEETPAHWHYTDKDDRYHRIGDIILVAHYPMLFHVKGMHMIPGEHGYDNAIPDMGATFYAWGPAFKSGLTLSPFENVNVYPLIAHLLGLKITQPVDGSFKVLSNTLKK